MKWKLSEIVEECRKPAISHPSYIRHLMDGMSQMPVKSIGHPKNDKFRNAGFELARIPLAQTGTVTYLDMVELLSSSPDRDERWWEDVLYWLGQITVGYVRDKSEVNIK